MPQASRTPHVCRLELDPGSMLAHQHGLRVAARNDSRKVSIHFMELASIWACRPGLDPGSMPAHQHGLRVAARNDSRRVSNDCKDIRNDGHLTPVLQ